MCLFKRKKKSKEDEYFNEIYFKYYKYAFTITLNLLKNSDLVDDVLQDAFIKVYKEIHKIEGIKNDLEIKAFISVIVKNTARNAAIKNSKDKSRLIDIEDDVLENILTDDTTDPLKSLVISEGVERIKREIHNLPEKYSQILELKYIHKYETAKIAELLELKSKTVYARVVRGKTILLEKLNSEEEK